MSEKHFCHYGVFTKGVLKGDCGEGRNAFAIAPLEEARNYSIVRELADKMNSLFFTQPEMAILFEEFNARARNHDPNDKVVYMLNNGVFMVKGLLSGVNYLTIPPEVEYDPNNPAMSDLVVARTHGIAQLNSDNINHAYVWRGTEEFFGFK